MHKAALTILAASALLLSSGCGNRIWEDGKKLTKNSYNYVFDSSPTAVPLHDTSEIPMIEINHDAADKLNANLQKSELSKFSPVYVSAFTNQVNPGDAAIFGTVVASQVADRLVQKGLRITEGTPSGTDYLYSGGTSEADYRGITDKQRAKLPPRVAQLTGNYVLGDDYIYLSAKITRLVDKAVVSAHNWTIPVSGNVRELLPQLKTPGEGMAPSVKTQLK